MTLVMTAADTLHLETVLLGPLEVRAETVIHFAAGLPGFVDRRRFVLVETQRDDLIWLQSVDDPTLTFLLSDPFATVPGFELELPASDLAALGAAAGGAASLLVLAVTQLERGVPVSANLQSPIVIDRDRRVGRQVVVPDSVWGMHHPVTII
jgi:flagellar assembly factor FliW